MVPKYDVILKVYNIDIKTDAALVSSQLTLNMTLLLSLSCLLWTHSYFYG